MIPVGHKKLTAELTIPAGAHTIIVFARSGADAHLNRHERAVAAAAAIRAAVCLDEVIDALVCCSGRTDLAAETLPELLQPALLIAGSLDRPVLEFNREALALLSCPRRLEIIQGATHLPDGTHAQSATQLPEDKSDEIVELAMQWFNTHLKCLVS